jgi:hypothetical protein
MDRGELRHPVFGRSRRLKLRSALRKRLGAGRSVNPWVEQRIKPGLVVEPAMRAMPAAVQKLDEAVHRVTEKIGRAS